MPPNGGMADTLDEALVKLPVGGRYVGKTLQPTLRAILVGQFEMKGQSWYFS
jgi:hypothetical protein